MRLFEFNQPVKLYASKRYLKSAAAFARGYPAFAPALRSFLAAKIEHPLVPFGKKDEPFTGGGGGLKEAGAWHAHLVHGKVVLIYKSTASSVTLYDVVEHDGFEGKQMRVLGNFITTADVDPISAKDAALTPAEKAPVMTAAQKAELNDLLTFMVQADRDILKLAAAGDFSGLMEFVAMVPLPWESVLIEMGGTNRLRRYLNGILA